MRPSDVQDDWIADFGFAIFILHLVFTNEIGKPVRPAKLTRCYKQATAEAGFPKMWLHDLWHTVVTYLIESGHSPKTVQEFVEHTDARFTLKQYFHVVNKANANLHRSSAIFISGSKCFYPKCVQKLHFSISR